MFETLHAVLDQAIVFDGARQVSFARVRGSRVLESGVCPVDELGGLSASTLRVALASPLNFSQRVSLDVFRRSLVPFVARRQLEQDAVFSDRFRLRTEVLSLREGKAEACVVACLEDDAEMAMDSLPVQKHPLTRLAVAESAVAALVGRVTREPVLVLWYRAGLLTCLGVTRSRVMWQRTQRVDASQFTSQSPWRTQIERAVAAAPAEYSQAHGLRLNLGDGPWRQENAWAVNGSQATAEAIGKLFKGVSADTVLAAPELFGLAFVPRQANLVVNGYGQRVRAWHMGWPAAVLASFAGLALGATGLLASADAEKTNTASLAQAAPLASRYSQIQAGLPSEQAVGELQKVMAMNDTIVGSVRVDHLMAKLSSMVPARVQLKKVEVGRMNPGSAKVSAAKPVQAPPDADASAKVKAIAKPVPESNFYLQLDFVLKGSYAQTKQTAEVLVARLAELGTLEGTRMNHADVQNPLANSSNAENASASFSTRIVLDARVLP